MHKILFVYVCILFCFCSCKEKVIKDKELADSIDFIDSAKIVTSQTPMLITPDASNILPIDFVSVKLNDEVHQGISVSGINKILKDFTGTFQVIYPFEVKENIDFSTLKCALNIDTVCDVRINRKLALPIPSSCFINEQYHLYEIGKHAVYGRNEIVVSFQNKKQMKEQLAFILGVFSVWPATMGFQIFQPGILSTGSWEKQGMPFYSDAVTYSKIYTFGNDKSAGTLYLPEWHGASAMVFVNKELVGTVGKDERKLDISRFLLSGENKVDVKILGMRENTTGPFYLQDTLSQIPPSGYCYKFLPSGLYDDFSIGEP